MEIKEKLVECEPNQLYVKIYKQITGKIHTYLGNCVRDEDKSYQAAMALLMISMKMFMFAGIKKEDLTTLYENIDHTFDKVYNDFKRVDLKMK